MTTEPQLSQPAPYKMIASLCGTNACPTVYQAENDDLIVQGYVESLDVPEGEQAVRIPMHVIQEAMKVLTSNG